MESSRPNNRHSEYSIWIYPWDLLDGGADAVTGELADAGFTTLSVAATYHAGRLVLPHNPRRRVYFLEDGVAYFDPDPGRYGKTQLKPMRAGLSPEEDSLRRAISAAQQRRLKVHAWTVFFHNTRLGEQNPDVTIEDVYGERYIYALCPSHPQARAYATAVAADLSEHYELTGLELEAIGFMGYGHLSHHDKIGFHLDLLHDFLLSVCFCPYCKAQLQASGGDFDLIRENFRNELETYLSGDANSAVDDPLDVEARLEEILGRADLNALLIARDQTVSSLVKEIRQSIRKEIEIIMRAASSRFVTGGDAGIDWGCLSETVDRFLFLQFYREMELVKKDLSRVTEYRDRCRVPLHVGLRAYYPDVTTETELNARLQLLDECKVQGIQFYNYGLLPRTNLEWIRRAIQA